MTLMERNTHTSTAPTYGVAYFTSPRYAGGQGAHFLYPWQGLFIDDDRSFRSGITHGWGRLDVVNLQNRYIEASNAPGSAVHTLETVTIDNLPLSHHSCWLVLDPNQAPVVQ